MSALIDLTGNRYGHVVVVDRAGSRKGSATWNVICDCGSKKVMLGRDLKHRRVTSCGFRHYRRGSDHPSWGGHEQISLAKWGRIERRNRYVTSRIGQPFDITMKYAWEVFEKQGRCCALTGIPLVFGVRDSDPQTASLDRIDSRLGYVVGNVQWVHKDINRMKSVFDQDYFIAMCRAVAAHDDRDKEA